MSNNIDKDTQRPQYIDEVEIKSIYDIPSLRKYKDWTKVSRFLAYGLQGIKIREIK